LVAIGPKIARESHGSLGSIGDGYANAVPSLPADLRHEARRSIASLVAIPVMVVVIWGAGFVVMHSQVDRWDVRQIVWLVDHRTAWLDSATQWATNLAETIPVLAILLIAVVLARRWTHEWRVSVFLAVAVGGEKLVYLLSSLLVGRDRPPVPPLGSTYATSSFPSGHVGSAITLYGGIALAVGAWHGRKHLVALMSVTVAIAAIVAFSRMYCGFHYPSDCVAGALVGGVWLAIVAHVMAPLAASHAMPPIVTEAASARRPLAAG